MIEWRDIPGYEGRYQASSEGDVRSLGRATAKGFRSGRVLKQYIRPDNGRPQIELTDAQGRRRTVRVHVAVTEAFHGPRPSGMLACHDDDDVLNNRPENLRWDTPSANVQDSIQRGRHGQIAKTTCPAGHAYDKANTIHVPSAPTHRKCLTCRNERNDQRVSA